MSDQRGVFTLRTTNVFRKKEQCVDLNDVWHSPSPFLSSDVGYFGGGSPGPGDMSTVDKTTFTSDTTARVPGANLGLGRDRLAATGSQTHGYFGGGLTSAVSIMDKIDYSTDTTAVVPGANLVTARYDHVATGNKDAGYFAGGSPGSLTTIEKTTYSTDTTATLPSSANLSRTPALDMSAVGNNTHGYFAGGYKTSETSYSLIDRITYASDTTAALPSNADLSSGRRAFAATGNSTDGYITGGLPGPFNYVTIVDKITYSSETTARVPTANLSETRYLHAATGNSSNGYIGGGSGPKSSIDKITYSNDTTSALPSGAYLSRQRRYLAATGPRTNALSDIAPAPSSSAIRYIDNISGTPDVGYFGGGSPGPYSIMDKTNFSNDTTAAVPGANLSSPRADSAATGNSTNGYFGGGSTSTRMDKVTYSTDTTVYTPGANLNVVRSIHAATGTGDAGYFGGGFPGPTPAGLITVEKTTYSNDTTATLPATGNLSQARRCTAAVGNPSAGYFGGGYVFPDPVSTMDKITYSTDTIAALPGANIPSVDGRSENKATGNSTHGYFGGGVDEFPTTAMDKITYSTDTIAAVPGARLSARRNEIGATGNLDSGYFTGGYTPSNSSRTTISEKVTYSTDTISTAPSAGLTVARDEVSASSPIANAVPTTSPPVSTPSPSISGLPVTSPNVGYFGGGGPGPFSTMDKTNFTNDTTAAVPGANLTAANSYLSATGNGLAGYFSLGSSPSPSYIVSVDKVTYSTDTTAVLPSAANMQSDRNRAAATGNSDAGYFGGGFPGPSPAGSTAIDKLSYSFETTVQVPGASFPVGHRDFSATGNQTHGYFGGGGPSPNSTMDKTTYASDTTAPVPGANLNTARLDPGATGNSTHGYFIGGWTPGAVSTVEKVTYSSDTTAALPSGANISDARYKGAATGNSTHGYFAGGTPATVATTDKITYSTDTTAAAPGADLSVARLTLAASSPRANALDSIVALPTSNVI